MWQIDLEKDPWLDSNLQLLCDLWISNTNGENHSMFIENSYDEQSKRFILILVTKTIIHRNVLQIITLNED